MLPLYKQIYEDLKGAIKTKDLSPGDYIPSEIQLMKIYDCSRDTVRKATNLLAQKKYIEKSKGKPSMVLERQEYTFPTSKIRSFRELSQEGNIEQFTSVISIKELDNTYKTDKIYNKLKSDKVLEVKRVRNIAGEKIILDIDYFDMSFIPYLSEDIAAHSIYQYLEEDLGLKIGYSEKIITVEQPNEEDLKLLDLYYETLIVEVKSETYTMDKKLFQVTQSRHRSDKFEFTSYATR